MNKRLNDLKQLLRMLDITITMHKNAENKYKAIAKYLQENGLECDIYPQGSFALGTVVRAHKKVKNENYDLDFICLIKVNKNTTTAEIIKTKVGELLKQHEVYSKILTEYDKCWTLSFPEEFNIDIIPAAEDEKIELSYNFITKDRIAITDKKKESYIWLMSNPKGYTEWFEYINKPFLDYNLTQRTNEFCAKNDGKIDEIPDYDEKSSLQMVIQILKRHRDIYFDMIKKDDKKPISAIITTISAKIAEHAPKNYNVFELLEYIANEFSIYAMRNTISEDDFDKRYINKNVIKKSKDNWEILNPVNPTDNLADQWNEDPEKAVLFFKWTEVMKENLVNTKEKDDLDFITGVERGFGSDFVRKSIDRSAYTPKIEKTIPERKPWRKNGR
ncbi:nucleotidyltransferase domain-containing protein [Cetobacterium sp.]|uniref:nucleotidyltransferase domain-containing protein n=1 Tax=Cetobacterium sp. TaxID=2071632 RepID=UPI003EE692F1